MHLSSAGEASPRNQEAAFTSTKTTQGKKLQLTAAFTLDAPPPSQSVYNPQVETQIEEDDDDDECLSDVTLSDTSSKKRKRDRLRIGLKGFGHNITSIAKHISDPVTNAVHLPTKKAIQ